MNLNKDSYTHALSNQEIDKILLKDDIGALIQKYQHKIYFYCDHFIYKGLFTKEERSDIIQSVNERLWRKSSKIQYQYSGKSTVSTYLGKIIRNTCLEIYRKNKKVVPTEHVEDERSLDYLFAQKPSLSLDHLVIQEELTKLREILDQQAPAINAKTIFYFKLCCRIALKEQDITSYFVNCPEIYLIKLMRDFGGDYQLMKDKDIYAKIHYYESIVLKKTSTIDSVKKWMRYRANQIVKQLNAYSVNSNYDLDSLKILLYYFFKKK